MLFESQLPRLIFNLKKKRSIFVLEGELSVLDRLRKGDVAYWDSAFLNLFANAVLIDIPVILGLC